MLTLWGARPERAEAPSPGHRPGLLWAQPCRPVRAKALKLVIPTFLESQCKDTAIFRYHQISACDKARFSARFQSETC